MRPVTRDGVVAVAHVCHGDGLWRPLPGQTVELHLLVPCLLVLVARGRGPPLDLRAAARRSNHGGAADLRVGAARRGALEQQTLPTTSPARCDFGSWTPWPPLQNASTHLPTWQRQCTPSPAAPPLPHRHNKYPCCPPGQGHHAQAPAPSAACRLADNTEAGAQNSKHSAPRARRPHQPTITIPRATGRKARTT